MGKAIAFQLGDKTIAAELGTKIDKGALYGYARRTIEKDGRTLTRGYLSQDGRLLRRDTIALQKVDPEGSPVEDPMTEFGGKPVEPQPSSFESQHPLEPVPIATLVGFNVRDVYPLEGVELPPGLYRTLFSYRKSFQPQEALLLQREGEAFLMAGTFKTSALVGLSVAYEFFDSAEDEVDGDELDFSMV